MITKKYISKTVVFIVGTVQSPGALLPSLLAPIVATMVAVINVTAPSSFSTI